MNSQNSTDLDFSAPPGTVVVMHEAGYRSREPLKGRPKYEWDGRSVTV